MSQTKKPSTMKEKFLMMGKVYESFYCDPSLWREFKEVAKENGMNFMMESTRYLEDCVKTYIKKNRKEA